MFANNLKILRKKKGLTQHQLAETLKLSQSSVGNWESLGVMPPMDKVLLLADYFSVSIDYLLGREKKDNSIVINQNESHNPTATVTISNGENHSRNLSEIEIEILNVCESFSIKEKTQLLNCAYEIEKKRKAKENE